MQADPGEAILELSGLGGLGCLGGPGAEGRLARCGLGGEGAVGVAGPLAVWGKALLPFLIGAGVDRDLAPALLVGPADRDLDRCTAPVSGRTSGACRVSSSTVSAPTCSRRPQRQLEEGGAGQEDRAADGVVGQPGMGGEREAAGEQ